MNRKEYQKNWDKQLDIAEKKQDRIFSQYFRNQYYLGVERFLIEKRIESYDDLFKVQDLIKLYENLYSDIGLRMANWYASNYQKFIKKNQHGDMEDLWNEKFKYIGNTVAGQRVLSISGNRKKELIKVLKRFYSMPEFQVMGEDAAGRILRKKFREMSVSNAKRIIRTESVNAANYATNQSATDIFGKENLRKEWIATNDERTRIDHARADGQVVGMDEQFLVGGEELSHPGDSKGSAGNVINCRCTNAPFPIEEL